jgi:hypothetical protein
MGKLSIPNNRYLYIVRGVGLSPDINGLKFYDSNLISESAPIFYASDLSYKLQRARVFSNFYVWNMYKFNYPTDQTNWWRTNLIPDISLTPDLEYSAPNNGAVGTPVIYALSNKISLKKQNLGGGKLNLN